jgi:hypothetical protein
VTEVSRLAQHGISQALSISEHVVAVTVVHGNARQRASRAGELQDQWTRWSPGVPLQLLHTEYASVAGPIVAFVNKLRRRHHDRIIVLIPVALPDRLRYRFLHNHLDLVLTRALGGRSDIIVARVPVPLHVQRATARAARETVRSQDSELAARLPGTKPSSHPPGSGGSE